MPAFADTIPRVRALWARFTARVAPVEWLFLLLVGALYVAVHASQIAPVFGEQDGARMANDATGWHFAGKVHLETTDYRMRTSPLYIHGLKAALDHGLAIGGLPRFMTWVSLLFSALGLGAAYFLFRPLIGRAGAGIAVGFLILAPAYWMSGAYGMSHGPGLTAWLLGLCTFSLALQEGRSRRSFFWLSAGTAVWVFIALSLKADLVMNGLAFPGLAFVKRRLTRETFVVACAVVVVGLGLQMLYVRGVVTPLERPESSIEFATKFNSRFPFEWRSFAAGFRCITNAPGPVVFVVGLVGALQQLLGRRGVRLALFAIAWGLPIVLVWGFMAGNSARHNLSAMPPLALVTAAFLVAITETPWRAAILAAVVAAGNYVSDREGEPAGFGTVTPRTDVLALMPAAFKVSAETESWARSFARLGAEKKAIVCRWSLPFATFEVLHFGSDAKSVAFDGKTILVTRGDGRVFETRTLYAITPSQGNAAIRAYRDEGFTVWRRDF